ncbi:MAG: DUF4404 family protein [Planctomycetaceae bacterium]
MSHELAGQLETVRKELASGAPLGPEERAELEQLLQQISQVLQADATAEPSSAEEGSLSTQLLQVTERLEETHPNLTLAIGQVANALSGIGI